MVSRWLNNQRAFFFSQVLYPLRYSNWSFSYTAIPKGTHGITRCQLVEEMRFKPYSFPQRPEKKILSFPLFQQVNSIDLPVYTLGVTDMLTLLTTFKTASSMKGSSLIKCMHSKSFSIGFMKVLQTIERKVRACLYM